MMWMKPNAVAVSLMRSMGKANRDVKTVGGQGRLSLLAVSTVWASHGRLTGQTDREPQTTTPCLSVNTAELLQKGGKK